MIADGQMSKDDDCISVGIQGLIDEKVRDLRHLVSDFKETIESRVDAKFQAVEEKITYQAKASQLALDKAFESAQLATQKLEIATNSRFENTNEWRSAMKDREISYATRADIKFIDDRLATIENRNMGILVAVIIALVIALIAAYRTLAGI